MKLERIEESDKTLVIKLSGELDALGSNQVRPDLETITEDKTIQEVTLDLGEVTFLDSSGIGAIVFMYKRVKAGNRTLKLVEVDGQPRELIELLRIDSAIPVTMRGTEKLDTVFPS